MVDVPNGWRRSSWCADASCVEVNSADGVVLVRSTVEPAVELTLTPQQWRSLLDTVKAGGFTPAHGSGSGGVAPVHGAGSGRSVPAGRPSAGLVRTDTS